MMKMMMLLANSTSNSPSRRFQRSETSIAISERLASGRELLIRQQHHDVVTRSGEVDVFNLERKRLADAQTELGNEAEQQPVTATLRGDGSQDGGDPPRAQTAWCGWIEMDAVDPPPRVSGDELVTVRPGEEARDRGLLASPRCGRQVRNGREEAAQDFGGDG